MTRPSASDYLGFQGLVTRGTPGVPPRSQVSIEPEAGRWHLYIVLPTPAPSGDTAWDAWCDEWADAESWFEQWSITWTRDNPQDNPTLAVSG